jgi:23S rRNA maturation mini-RNase III
MKVMAVVMITTTRKTVINTEPAAASGVRCRKGTGLEAVIGIIGILGSG